MRRHFTSRYYSTKLSAIMRCMCVLSGCTYSGVFQQVQSSQKKTKEPNDGVLLRALLFGCVVSFGVCHLCLDTYRRNCKTGFDCITEVKNQTWVKSTRYTTLSMFFSYLQDVRFQRSAIHMCRTPKWQHCGVFPVVRNCFENLSWYFLVKQETFAPVTSHPLYMFKLL